jgi:ankyrin repeat protein
MAAQDNHMECVEFLIDSGAAVDRRTTQGWTPLLYAAESGHFELMTYLINRGATHFTYTDQQCEFYFVSYVIRQSITRRDVSRALLNDTFTALALEYLSLGGLKMRPVERLSAHVLPNTRKKPLYPARGGGKPGASPAGGEGGDKDAASPAAAGGDGADPEAEGAAGDDGPRPASPAP